MSVLYLLLPFALLLAGSFLFGFVKMAAEGQFDDLETPARRMLLDDESVAPSRPINRGKL